MSVIDLVKISRYHIFMAKFKVMKMKLCMYSTHSSEMEWTFSTKISMIRLSEV